MNAHNTLTNMVPNFVLVAINIAILFLVGLYPLRELLHANYELGGIVFLFLSWVLWIPSIFIAILLYWTIGKVANFVLVSKTRIVTITLIIQIIAIFSVSPGLALFYKYRVLVDQAKVKVSSTVDFERIDALPNGSYVYNYKISVDNATDQVQDIQYRILTMLEDPEAYTKYCPLVSATYNNLTRQKIAPGKSILSGELVLFDHIICDKFNPNNSKVKLQITINAGYTNVFQYRDTLLSNWGPMYQDYKNKQSSSK